LQVAVCNIAVDVHSYSKQLYRWYFCFTINEFWNDLVLLLTLQYNMRKYLTKTKVFSWSDFDSIYT